MAVKVKLFFSNLFGNFFSVKKSGVGVFAKR